MLHSIYDLTTYCRKTTGDVPAKLVGASTTVVGSKMYLFGGRLVTERRMVSDLYVFDLETFVWERIAVFPEDVVPQARYFHSADAWNDYLVVFGGMSNQPDSPNPEELCVLNDVRFFHLATRHWLPASPIPTSTSDSLIPRARYAHLSSITADRLFIIGGQDFFNTWLDDVCVYDLVGKTWVQRRDYPRHCGTYRSVAVSSHITVRTPQDELQAGYSASTLGPPGSRFHPAKMPISPGDVTPSQNLVHLPYSATPTEDHPSDIYLYSNYNFTDVKRELEVFSPLPDVDFTIQDRSSAMTGATFPPGLRFPTGAVLGTHLIIAGTYLAHSYQSYSIWVLDLNSMTWSRIDPGKALESGSWFRGCLWSEANKFLIFGNRHGNLVDDYNRRLLSWDHVAVVDLEAFGIYQAPPLKIDIRMQELGLAALEERVLTDFEVVCDDGRKIACSRKILEERWPWFKEKRRSLLKTANATLQTLPTSPMHVPLPDVPGSATFDQPRLDPRLTPRSFHLSEPYPVALALVQYLYSYALITPLQHAPTVLSQLLILSISYGIPHLESLVKHAMHRALSNSTSVGVYEVATLCSCRSLQIRALKTVMSYTQKRPSRSRNDKDLSGNGRPPDNERGGSSHGAPGSLDNLRYTTSRPRGTSDARWRTTNNSGFSSDYNSRGRAMQSEHHNVIRSENMPKPFDENDTVESEMLQMYVNATPPISDWPMAVDPSSDIDYDQPPPPSPPPPSTSSRSKFIVSPYLPQSPQNANPSHTLDSDSSDSNNDYGRKASYPTSRTILSFHLPRPRLAPIYTGSSQNILPALNSSASHISISSSSESHGDISPVTPSSGENISHPLPIIVDQAVFGVTGYKSRTRRALRVTSNSLATQLTPIGGLPLRIGVEMDVMTPVRSTTPNTISGVTTPTIALTQFLSSPVSLAPTVFPSKPKQKVSQETLPAK